MSPARTLQRSSPPLPADDHVVTAINRLPAVHTALQVLRRVTGLRMALVARVTPETWTACAVLDEAGFGLEVGQTLDVATTYCRDVFMGGAPLVVSNAREDPRFCSHPGLLVHGIHTYVAVPLFGRTGEPFGALCALDPDPTPVSEDLLPLFHLLARSIALELDAEDREREATRLLEQRAEALSALRQSERRLRFLDMLGQQARQLDDSRDVLAMTTRLLGEHLNASRCAYAYVAGEGDHVTVEHDWTPTGAPSSAGAYRLEAFGSRLAADMRAGRTVVIHDVLADLPADEGGSTLAALGTGAIVCCPRVRDGKLLAVMAVHQNRARQWLPAEVSLVEETVERSWAHIETLKLHRALQDTDRRKDEFLATLAHELRNPLAPIRSGLELLNRTNRDSGVAAHAREIMGRQLAHLVRLVDDLLDVSRVSRGKIRLTRELVDLETVVANAVETSAPLVHSSRHALTVDLPREPLLLHADPVRLSQVFSNILINAAKYTPPSGRIEITAERGDRSVHVRIKDTGVGIPANMVGAVFEMFTQVGRTLDRAQGGLGVGLTLVRRLVEMHGGTVTAHSTGPGTGTTVAVTLPLAPPSVTHKENERPETGETSETRALRVLVVDDHEDGAEMLSLLIAAQGHQVSTTATGEAALQALETLRPDVAFLDIGLPGVDGYEVARRIRQRREHSAMTLVALTGWGSREDKVRASDAGFDLHLTKPVDPSLVQAVLHDVRTR